VKELGKLIGPSGSEVQKSARWRKGKKLRLLEATTRSRKGSGFVGADRRRNDWKAKKS